MRPASSGYANEVWFARIGDDECVVRAPKRSAEALRWEIDLLARAGASGLGVPLVISTPDGRTSVDGIVVFHKVEGERPSTLADWALVRDYLARLHDVLRGSPQRPGFLAAADLLDADAGGLVDFAVMPEDAVARCRGAWAQLSGLPQTVIHGDPGAENVFVAGDEVVLIDWDESRVDTELFDLAALPDDVSPLSPDERRVAQQAASAWEAAISWSNDNEYARWRLSQVEA